MPETAQGPITGKEYRFLEDGFQCKDWNGLIPYESVTGVTSEEKYGCFDISFLNKKGKKRKVTVILESYNQKAAVQALLLRKVPGATSHTRSQTAWEAMKGWVTVGLSLAAIVVIIILLNTWGRGASVSVPLWLLPVIMIGSFLSTKVLLIIAAAILVIFGGMAVISLGKRQGVWVLDRPV